MRSYSDELADSFVQARLQGTPLAPPRSERFVDLDGAYAVQRSFVERWSALGARKVTGYKISATSERSQAALGIVEPIMGSLFDEDVLGSPSEVGRAEFHSPLAEAELVFLLVEDLPELCSREDIIAGTHVAPGIELADSRFKDWPVGIAGYSVEDIVSDNAFGAKLVVGAGVAAATLDLTRIAVRLHYSGRVAANGHSSAVLDDPVRAVSWLARAVHRLGGSMSAGTVISTGAIAGPVPVGVGRIEAEFAGLGQVSVSLTASEQTGS